MILDASATLMDGALCMVALIMDPYISDTIESVFSSIAPTTLAILSTVCSLSPGLILSGLYQIVKSFGQDNPLTLSRTGRQISSVAPGSTVDSYTTICQGCNIDPIISLALIRGV